MASFTKRQVSRLTVSLVFSGPTECVLHTVFVRLVAVCLLVLVRAMSSESSRNPFWLKIRIQRCLVSASSDATLCNLNYRGGVSVAPEIYSCLLYTSFQLLSRFPGIDDFQNLFPCDIARFCSFDSCHFAILLKIIFPVENLL